MGKLDPAVRPIRQPTGREGLETAGCRRPSSDPMTLGGHVRSTPGTPAFSLVAWTLFLLWMLPVPAGAAPAREILEVAPANNPESVIDTTVRVRERLPDTLFGFNVQHFYFQKDLWLAEKGTAEPTVIAALAFFPGALYRYPGGLVANRFAWQDSIGPPKSRHPQKSVQSAAARPVLFGVDEYLTFVNSVAGQPLYVLNLAGWDEQQMTRELSAQDIRESNRALAEHMRKRLDGTIRYYQLGNELDRSKYQWSHAKYVERAKDTIEAIRDVDPEARFVAFLRDFDWRYRGDGREGRFSHYEQFITDVLNGLPSVQDFSLQFYYDDPGMDNKLKQIPARLRQFNQAFDVAARVRGGKMPGVWITEHARGINLGAGKVAQRAALTSNLAAAVSTGDFMTALAQMPEVRGAAWHGLNGGPWQLFDATIEHRDLRPRPVYWGLRVLRAIDLPVVLATRTGSPNASGYAGGYDVRTAGFTDEKGEQLGLWAVNRSVRMVDLRLEVTSWKDRTVEVRHFYLCGEPGVDADDPRVKLDIQLEPVSESSEFSSSGELILRLPPSSVSSFLILRSTGARAPK